MPILPRGGRCSFFLKWILRPKSGASKSRPRWAAHTRIGSVWEYPPQDPAIIRSIIDRHGAEEASLKDLRIAAISSLGFAGFFRFNELANIQPKHLTFCDGFGKLFVLRSKTDVCREGNAQQLPYVGILKQPIWICLVTCLYSGH